MGTVRSSRPWMGYPPQMAIEPALAEFDWDSLRRWDEDETSTSSGRSRAWGS